jgi:hypothetical protein
MNTSTEYYLLSDMICFPNLLDGGSEPCDNPSKPLSISYTVGFHKEKLSSELVKAILQSWVLSGFTYVFQVLLSRLRLFLSPKYPYEEMLRTFHNQTNIIMCSYLPVFKSFNRTKGINC